MKKNAKLLVLGVGALMLLASCGTTGKTSSPAPGSSDSVDVSRTITVSASDLVQLDAPSRANPGEIVTVGASLVNEKAVLDGVFYNGKKAGKNEEGDFYFLMPDADVSLSATAHLVEGGVTPITTYSITNGVADVALMKGPTEAKEGEVITFSFLAKNGGIDLDGTASAEIPASEEGGEATPVEVAANEDGTFSLTMPASAIVIKAGYTRAAFRIRYTDSYNSISSVRQILPGTEDATSLDHYHATFGSRIRVTLTDNDYAKHRGIRIVESNQEIYPADGTLNCEFIMPAHEIHIEPIEDKIYYDVRLIGGDHLGMKLYTRREDDNGNAIYEECPSYQHEELDDAGNVVSTETRFKIQYGVNAYAKKTTDNAYSVLRLDYEYTYSSSWGGYTYNDKSQDVTPTDEGYYIVRLNNKPAEDTLVDLKVYEEDASLYQGQSFVGDWVTFSESNSSTSVATTSSRGFTIDSGGYMKYGTNTPRDLYAITAYNADTGVMGVKNQLDEDEDPGEIAFGKKSALWVQKSAPNTPIQNDPNSEEGVASAWNFSVKLEEGVASGDLEAVVANATSGFIAVDVVKKADRSHYAGAFINLTNGQYFLDVDFDLTNADDKITDISKSGSIFDVRGGDGAVLAKVGRTPSGTAAVYDGVDAIYAGDDLGSITLDGYGTATIGEKSVSYAYLNGSITLFSDNTYYELALNTTDHTYATQAKAAVPVGTYKGFNPYGDRTLSSSSYNSSYDGSFSNEGRSFKRGSTTYTVRRVSIDENGVGTLYLTNGGTIAFDDRFLIMNYSPTTPLGGTDIVVMIRQDESGSTTLEGISSDSKYVVIQAYSTASGNKEKAGALFYDERDANNRRAYFGVTITGYDGTGDPDFSSATTPTLLVKDSAGNELLCLKKGLAKGAEVGAFTGALGTITLDGFGGGTLVAEDGTTSSFTYGGGGTSISISSTDGTLSATIYALDLEARTYAASKTISLPEAGTFSKLNMYSNNTYDSLRSTTVSLAGSAFDSKSISSLGVAADGANFFMASSKMYKFSDNMIFSHYNGAADVSGNDMDIYCRIADGKKYSDYSFYGKCVRDGFHAASYYFGDEQIDAFFYDQSTTNVYFGVRFEKADGTTAYPNTDSSYQVIGSDGVAIYNVTSSGATAIK